MDKTVKNFAKQGRAFLDDATDQVQSMTGRSFGALNDTAQQALDAVSDATDTAIGYAKKNPGKALLIAAASGALVLAVLKMLAPSRD